MGIRRLTYDFLDKTFVKVVLGFSLIFALAGGPIFALADVPDDPGLVILDVIMTAIMVIFILEFVANIIADPAYRFSFFFCMDLLGSVSMIFEISFLLGETEGVNTVVLRSARAAKLGARAGRLGKAFSMIMKEREKKDTLNGKKKIEANVLASRLTTKISTRVSMLTIFLVIVMPLFDLPIFPVDERSLVLWAQQMEEHYAISQDVNRPDIFDAQVDNMLQFYSIEQYRPYRMVGWGNDLGGRDPARSRNTRRFYVTECRLVRSGCDNEEIAHILFDFTTVEMVQAAVDIGLMFVVIALMMVMTFDMRKVMDKMLVSPLEKMLEKVRASTESIFEQFSAAALTDEIVDQYADGEKGTELEIIELTLEKLSRIATTALGKNTMSKDELAAMNASDKGVLELVGVEVQEEKARSTLVLKPWVQSLDGHKKETEVWLQTWDVNTLEISEVDCEQLVLHVFFDSEFGLAPEFATDSVFFNFMARVKPQYTNVPYHCYPHACDVLHAVWRIMCKTGCKFWVSKAEQYALLIAAYCHDLGHFGKTNPFLVEAEHEMAIRYNDKSPLENMHASKLFEICKDKRANIFGKMSRELQKKAREVAVAAILHTDNANHFAMIKDITQIYEMQEGVCDAMATEDGIILPNYCELVLEPNKLLFLELFLHFSDVSNALKPWAICYVWAMRVLDEFFAQGDEEKELGLPVGMLNDRAVVNRPGSQHGFINFLVAPLVGPTVDLFPCLTEMHVQMAVNISEWRNLWVEDAKPPAEAIAKKDADVQKVKEKSQQLQKRRIPNPKAVSRSATKHTAGSGKQASQANPTE
eukprot:TRINITY_DN28063_c0_g1_i1.p1 TRINITY_DN28063_c0_g1~~TRINITY_DN28063_c0_g1_i1.p1  ORF type:complete len:813 (+),score=168.30 TRINITY_DN28063_c0_g1_i1:185-2623(+)